MPNMFGWFCPFRINSKRTLPNKINSIHFENGNIPSTTHSQNNHILCADRYDAKQVLLRCQHHSTETWGGGWGCGLSSLFLFPKRFKKLKSSCKNSWSLQDPIRDCVQQGLRPWINLGPRSDIASRSYSNDQTFRPYHMDRLKIIRTAH